MELLKPITITKVYPFVKDKQNEQFKLKEKVIVARAKILEELKDGSLIELYEPIIFEYKNKHTLVTLCSDKLGAGRIEAMVD